MIICADRIIAGDGKTVYLNSAVLVDDKGIISAIDKAETLKQAHPNEKVICYEDSTLLPGYIDLHYHPAHYMATPRVYENNEFMLAYVAKRHADKAFQRGVTTFRETGSPSNVTLTLIAAGEMGYFDIPRIFPCGTALCIIGGHGTLMGIAETVEEVTGPWDVRRAVRERVKAGNSWIKVMTSHRSDLPEFTQEELDAAVDESHRLGKKIMVHSGTQPSIQMCIDAGFDTIEHGTFMTVEQALQMKEKGLAWTPTILPYVDFYNQIKAQCDAPDAPPALSYYRRAAEAYRDNFLNLANTGVKMGAGTDLITKNGECDPWIARELGYMVEYGLEPLRAIQVGTSNGAEILGIGDRVGRVEVGMEADLQIVRGNPTLDIRALDDLCHVLKKGKTVYQNS